METDNKKNYYGASIIPHSDNKNQKQSEQIFIDDAINGLFSQTDEDWCAIIVANKSTNKKAADYLNLLKEKHFQRST